MKYAIIFLVIFSLGFGTLYLFNKETPAPVVESPETQVSDVPQVVEEVKAPLSDSIAAFLKEPDTINYSMVKGYYDISWKNLSRVKFEDRLNEALQVKIPYPIFHPSIQKLDGKKIQIKGYVIPFEETGDATIVILSAFPFSSCFFCGGAGAETVMDVQLKNQKTRFKQDALVTFRGKLRLNDSDLDYLNYILDDAEVLD